MRNIICAVFAIPIVQITLGNCKADIPAVIL